MKIFYHKAALNTYLSQFRADKMRIGLVPTMGALHKGHLSLLEYIDSYCDIRVCSVFVNPTQFDKAEDLEKYPRPIEQDLKMLEEAGCDVVFMPSVEEMYGENESWSIDLGNLDHVLEGTFRPGHYQGVTQIVKKLFDIVMPNIACFGQKDYQQFLVIKKMVDVFKLKVKLLMCPIIREEDGLAMSSRNVRLTATGRKQALAIYQTLTELTESTNHLGLIEARKQAIHRLEASEGIRLEYLEVCDLDLTILQSAEKGQELIALAAVWLEGVRLIDNVIFSYDK